MNMVDAAVKADRMIGMIQPRPGGDAPHLCDHGVLQFVECLRRLLDPAHVPQMRRWSLSGGALHLSGRVGA